MPIAVEPRKKSCAKKRCGKCANCLNKEWNKTWRSLSPEWQEWVIRQFHLTLIWADETASMSHAKFLAGPSLTSYRKM